jgi:hypothetical protein
LTLWGLLDFHECDWLSVNIFPPHDSPDEPIPCFGIREKSTLYDVSTSVKPAQQSGEYCIPKAKIVQCRLGIFPEETDKPDPRGNGASQTPHVSNKWTSDGGSYLQLRSLPEALYRSLLD